ncbi:ABC-F family ATP-binding cassette domain-containing protein [Parabacteroides sp. AM08-6]|uniref:ABC-F family ATP-binding cassette domain-containing protein n=1 Tax=Parabacteroides sp. AM08-6 TaxID=2292053 RepID=UPI000EFEDA06|nr:ABC-F family ATP-binding cassette domain-containing protein [Parabacteroides sp. AM08-6]RHJ82563.1 ABC transporter ATP-binding protein [Parabacteroides sp. AM08-6]
MSIILSGVSYHYYNQQALFECVNLSVATGGKVSVIGNNGTGKSTLLKLIAGELKVSSGSIRCASTPYYIPQQIGITGISITQALGVSDKIEALHAICNGSDKHELYDILADDWNIESRCRIALDAWGLSDMELNAPIDSLSGGEKTKLFLAGIAIHNPGIILLDEPTNHLDYTSRRKLYEFIAGSKAAIIIVSHDIALLNLLEETYELSPKGLKLYGGNYDFYKAQKEIETQALINQIDAGETALRLARKKAQKVKENQERRVNRGAKETSGQPRIILKGRQDKGENTEAKLKSKQADIIDRNCRNLNDLRQKQNAESELKFDFNHAQLHNGKLLVSAHEINFKYERKGLLWHVPLDVEIRSGERIHIIGDNGSGKTTLLKLLIGELSPSIGKIIRNDFSFVYLDQEYSKVKTSQTVLELAQEYNRSNLLDHEIKLRLHRALFPKQMWDKPCHVLSGGERMRLYLCCLMISNHMPDTFILDEPTNNLDLSSFEILATTIKNYQGTLLIISHDKRFIEEVDITKVIYVNNKVP